jgi:hypothetical protein
VSCSPLFDRIDDPMPDRSTGEVSGRYVLVNPPDAFCLGRDTVPSEHQVVGGASDVDFGYHAERVKRAELETFKSTFTAKMYHISIAAYLTAIHQVALASVSKPG